ncbi:glycosyltransferase [Candidatus Peregrinibacteria bacterium]|nr:glycosyltransferase [Candidatus Peregrinibacteria bacterium]
MRSILAFGYHDQSAPRHWNLKKLYEGRGLTMVECHTTARGLTAKWRDLGRKFHAMPQDAEAVLVMFPGHTLVLLAWHLTRHPRKRLIFDAFISLWDTQVLDRKKYSVLNPIAWALYLLDWLSMHLADEVLIDTEEHRTYLIRTFGLRPDRVTAVPVGTRPDLFKPGMPHSYQGGTFNVIFYGTYIPLQGIEHILAAAAKLQASHPDVHFTLVGTGQTYPAMRKFAENLKLRNVTFRDRIPYEELPRFLQSGHVSLGIFGTSRKAKRVIPHKVYDAVACGVPVITMDSPAIREKYREWQGVHLVPPGDSEALARKIAELRDGKKW